MTNAYADGCAYVDGEYAPVADATISILDAGFLRSDVTYDAVAVWKGKFFRLDAHLDRFERSWRGLRMTPTLSRAEMAEIVFECVRRSGIRDAFLCMILTRGVPEQGLRDPRRSRNRFYVYSMPYVWIVSPEEQETGSHLVIAQDTIRISEQSVDPTAKNFHWGDLTRAMFETYDRGGRLAVLPDAEGNIMEGPGFNVFAVSEGTLYTPPRGVLEGITRLSVLDLAKQEGIPAKLEAFDGSFLRGADEVFVTTTGGGVMPITVIDGEPVGEGVVGPLTKTLKQRYWEAHEEGPWTTVVDY